MEPEIKAFYIHCRELQWFSENSSVMPNHSKESTIWLLQGRPAQETDSTGRLELSCTMIGHSNKILQALLCFTSSPFISMWIRQTLVWVSSEYYLPFQDLRNISSFFAYLLQSYLLNLLEPSSAIDEWET